MAVYNPGPQFTRNTSTVKDDRIELHGVFKHAGNDWAADIGSPIPAAADGKVVIIGNDASGYGHYVVLEHKDKTDTRVYTLYAQMNERTQLKRLDQVLKNDIVGYSGNSGQTSTGPHLHFEIRLGTKNDADYVGYGDYYGRKIADPLTYDIDQLQNKETEKKNASAQSQSQSQNQSQTQQTSDQQDQAPLTSEQDQDIQGYCTPTACEDDVFIIQVMGKDHDTKQQIIIVDEKGKELSSTATAIGAKTDTNAPSKEKIEVIEKDENRLTSTLHIWDWSKQKNKKRKLALKIKTEKGGAIILPFTDEFISDTQRKDDEQQNQIVPLIPFSLVKSINMHEQGLPALTKPGYLYIYKDKELWREIKIIQNEAGKTTYQDIDLTNCQKDGKFIKDQRDEIGVELENIWLPRKYQGTSKLYTNRLNFKVKYSEVQLSAARLNYLQEKPEQSLAKDLFHDLALSKAFIKEKFDKLPKPEALLQKRIKNPGIILSQYENIAAHKTGLFLIKERFTAQRARHEELECYFDDPISYLYDTTPEFFKSHVKQAKSLINKAEAGELIDLQNVELGAFETELTYKVISSRKDSIILEQVNKIIMGNILQGDNNAKLYENPTQVADEEKEITDFFTQKIAEAKKEQVNELKYNTEYKTFWLGDTGENILAPYQQQEIYGFVVEDHRQQITHITKRMTATQLVMQYAVERSGQYQHSDSALLLQQLMTPLSYNNKPNELRNALAKLNEQGYKEIAKQSAAHYRRVIRLRYQALQEVLTARINTKEQAFSWADHLSLENGGAYTASYAALTLAISMLSTSANSLDPLYVEGAEILGKDSIIDGYTKPESFTLCVSIATGIMEPAKYYHSYLWRQIKDEDEQIKIPYKLPETITKNDGSGKFRPDLIASTAKNGVTVPVKQITKDLLLMLPADKEKTVTEKIQFSGGEVTNLLGYVSTAFVNAVTEANERLNNHLTSMAAMRQQTGEARQQANTSTAEAQRARAALVGAGEVKRITLYGLTADQIQVQNVDIIRTLNAGTPIAEVSVANIVRHYPGRPIRAPGNTGDHTTRRTGRDGRIVRTTTNGGRVILINGRPVDQVNMQVVLFEDDGLSNASRANVTLLDAAGNSIADGTRERAVRMGLPEAGVRTNFLGIVYPGSGQLAPLLEADRQARELARAEVARTRAIRTANASNYRRMMRERHTYQQAYRRAVNNSVHRALQSSSFAIGMFAFKTFAFYNEVNNYKTITKSEGRARAWASIIVSGTDFAFAAEELIYRLAFRANQNALPSLLRLSVRELEVRGYHWRLNRVVIAVGAARFGYLAMGQALFATVGAAAALYDFVKSIDRNENFGTQLGKSITLFGATLGIFATFSASTFLVFGVLGLAALITIGLGMLISYYFSTSPLENWLANGPFGHDQSKDYAHLQGDQAFYRLAGLFVNVSITYATPGYNGVASLDGIPIDVYGDKKFEDIIKQANLRISVQNNIGGLVTGDSTPLIFLYSKNKAHDINKMVLAKERNEGGVTYYINYPGPLTTGSKPYELIGVRAQFLNYINNKLLVFPAPSEILDDTQYNIAKDSVPNVNKTGRDFWADEESNRTPAGRPGEMIGSNIL